LKLDVAMLTHDLTQIPDYARKVEALGYDCLWSAETQHDPFLPLAVAATCTSRIKLGTSIAVAFPRSPMVLAHISWDLAKASGGRFILGLGSQVKGHNERRFSVKWDAPAPRMREVVQALRAIWSCWQNGTPLNFLNPRAFAQPDLGTFGDLPRNAVEGPGLWNLDASLVRGFALRGMHRLELRVEAFNVLNHVRLGNPVTNLNSPTFGQIQTALDPRVLQLAVKYVF